MRKMVRRLLGGEEGGIGTLMVVGFVAISVPMLTAALALAGTLSHGSQVKNNLARSYPVCPIPGGEPREMGRLAGGVSRGRDPEH
jgi:hypothetical protein